MRSGLGDGGTRTEGETAGLLRIRLVRVQRLERRGLGNLRAAAASGGCDARGGQSAGVLVGSSWRPSGSSTGSFSTALAARPVGLFTAPFSAPIASSRPDNTSTGIVLAVGLVFLLLALVLLLAWRDRLRADADRARRFKELVGRVAHLRVALQMMREKANKRDA